MNAPHHTFPDIAAENTRAVLRAPTPWHQTPAARAAIAAVVLAGEQPTPHRAVYAQTTDEFYSYEGPLAARVNTLWAEAFEEADQAYREGNRDAYSAWNRAPKPDAAIDAAYAVRGF